MGKGVLGRFGSLDSVESIAVELSELLVAQ